MTRATGETALLASDLLPSVVMHEELSWFFEPALTAPNVPSSYAAMRRRARVGRAKGVALTCLDRPADRSVDARRAARTIHRWLMQLGPVDRDLLAAVYTADHTSEAMMDRPHGRVARAIRAYQHTRRGNSVVPYGEMEWL